MIDPQAIQQIRTAPIAERLRLIELILQSLKEEMLGEAPLRQRPAKPFTLRTHDLGEDIHLDRDELYADRAG